MEQNESMEQNEYSEKKSIELKQHEKNCHNEVVDNEMTAPQDLSPRYIFETYFMAVTKCQNVTFQVNFNVKKHLSRI